MFFPKSIIVKKVEIDETEEFFLCPTFVSTVGVVYILLILLDFSCLKAFAEKKKREYLNKATASSIVRGSFPAEIREKFSRQEEISFLALKETLESIAYELDLLIPLVPGGDDPESSESDLLRWLCDSGCEEVFVVRSYEMLERTIKHLGGGHLQITKEYLIDEIDEIDEVKRLTHVTVHYRKPKQLYSSRDRDLLFKRVVNLSKP
jgi:hypothetical protein